MATTITPDQFEDQVIAEQQPVIVDFFADWCNPCTQYSPVFEGVAEQTDDVKFVKVNIGEDPSIAQRYGIRSVPTTGAFRDGEMIESRSGVLEQTSLMELTKVAKNG